MDYIISDDDFKSSDDFLDWFLDNKPFDKKFEFRCKDNIKNLYLFLMYYFENKKIFKKKSRNLTIL